MTKSSIDINHELAREAVAESAARLFLRDNPQFFDPTLGRAFLAQLEYRITRCKLEQTPKPAFFSRQSITFGLGMALLVTLAIFALEETNPLCLFIALAFFPMSFFASIFIAAGFVRQFYARYGL